MEFYLIAFYELSSDRLIGFGEGHIPLTSIFSYANFYQLDRDETEDLIYFIKYLDVVYLKTQNKKYGKSKNSK